LNGLYDQILSAKNGYWSILKMNNKKSLGNFIKFFFGYSENRPYKINKIQKIIDEQGWKLPLNKEKIETIEKLMEKYHLGYFIRKSRFHVLYDYPCMGAFERRLRYSEIEGPYESAPKVKKEEYASESSEEVLESLVPTSSIPIELEKVSLVEYGTQVDRNSQIFMRFIDKKEINQKRIIEIGKRALENLHKGGVNIKKSSASVYKTSVDDCILEFRLAESYVYPEVKVTIFGKDEKPYQLLQGLELYELREQFPFWIKDVGIKDCIHRGLAYNLSLKNLDLDKILAGKNIIL